MARDVTPRGASEKVIVDPVLEFNAIFLVELAVNAVAFFLALFIHKKADLGKERFESKSLSKFDVSWLTHRVSMLGIMISFLLPINTMFMIFFGNLSTVFIFSSVMLFCIGFSFNEMIKQMDAYKLFEGEKKIKQEI
ncbi:hypothetical protein [Fulvitalea axinellae]